MESFLRFLTLAGLLLCGCQTSYEPSNYQPGQPYVFPNSRTIQGFLFSPADSSLTVYMLDGSTNRHLGVPAHLAEAFAKDGGHVGFYQTSIQKRYLDASEIEYGGEKYTPLHSTLFRGVRYEASRRKLHLLQHSGAVLTFLNVPQDVYRGFMDAPVKGGYYHGYIAGTYVSEEASPLPRPAPPAP